MSDMYIEILIPRIRSAASVLGQAALITLTGLAIVCGVVLHPLFLIGAVAFLVVDFIFLPRFNVEYEYLYVNGELTVDRIFSKSRRKRAGSYRIDQLELLTAGGLIPGNRHPNPGLFLSSARGSGLCHVPDRKRSKGTRFAGTQ